MQSGAGKVKKIREMNKGMEAWGLNVQPYFIPEVGPCSEFFILFFCLLLSTDWLSFVMK